MKSIQEEIKRNLGDSNNKYKHVTSQTRSHMKEMIIRISNEIMKTFVNILKSKIKYFRKYKEMHIRGK